MTKYWREGAPNQGKDGASEQDSNQNVPVLSGFRIRRCWPNELCCRYQSWLSASRGLEIANTKAGGSTNIYDGCWKGISTWVKKCGSCFYDAWVPIQLECMSIPSSNSELDTWYSDNSDNRARHPSWSNLLRIAYDLENLWIWHIPEYPTPPPL